MNTKDRQRRHVLFVLLYDVQCLLCYTVLLSAAAAAVFNSDFFQYSACRPAAIISTNVTCLPLLHAWHSTEYNRNTVCVTRYCSTNNVPTVCRMLASRKKTDCGINN